ncbi:MAG: DUF1127 domain-containing protein [Dongiaceae bacterium]
MRIFIFDALPLENAPFEPGHGPGVFMRIAAAIGRVKGRLALAMERPRQRRALARLSDHQLADIGLSREQVLAESTASVWQDDSAPASARAAVLVDDLRHAA